MSGGTPRIRIAACLLAALALALWPGAAGAGSLRRNAEDTTPPACIELPVPAYPDDAPDRSRGGTVLVQVRLDAAGTVAEVDLLDSDLPAPFVAAALAAARASRFDPSGGVDGLRVAIPLRFEAQEAPSRRPVDSAELETRAGRNEVRAVATETMPSTLEPEVVVADAPSTGGAETEPAAGAGELGVLEAAAGGSELRVLEAALGRDLRAGRLAETDSVFVEGERVYFLTRLAGGDPDRKVRHRWLREGRMIQEIPLELKDDEWRTWSYKTLFDGMTGDWMVQLRDHDGYLLAQRAFRADSLATAPPPAGP